ncbi:MAG: hypothetical protein ABI563_19365 [Specibacter sp.]
MRSREQSQRLDAVEIKFNVDASGLPAAMEALELNDAEARHRTIYFFEDLTGSDGPAGLPLLTNGIILRLRGNNGHRGDVTVKLRPCGGDQLTRRWLKADKGDGWSFRVESDWAGPNQTTSASLEAKIAEDAVDAVLMQGSGIPLVPEQGRFLEDCARVRVDQSQLTPLGPIGGTKWDLTLKGQEIAAEQWVVGDRLRFLELSIRVTPEEAPVAQQALEKLLRKCRIDLDSVHETKTRLVMEYLASASSGR